MKILIALVVAVATLIAVPAMAQNIDTRAAATTNIAALGPGVVETMGQTFTVPAGQGAVSSFSVRARSLPSSTVVHGVLMAWNNGTSRAVGPVLYESGDVNTTGATVQDLAFTIPGNAAVTAGQTYVIFLSTVNSASAGSGDLSFTPADVLAGGEYFFQGSASAADWTGAVWANFGGTGRDLGVTVDFVPAPSTVPTLSEWAMILMGLTLAGAGAVWTMRRRWA